MTDYAAHPNNFSKEMVISFRLSRLTHSMSSMLDLKKISVHYCKSVSF